MTMQATNTPATNTPEAVGDAAEAPDGRQLRRLRNIEAVRSAILDLQLERVPLDLDTVADRAGVTVRSIYRYHADLDAAIQDAYENRLAEVFEFWDRWETPDPTLPIEDRIELLLDHRASMERLGRPLRHTQQTFNPDVRFDREVLDTFAGDLARLPEDHRVVASATVCYLCRPRVIRAMSEAEHPTGVEPRALLSFLVRQAFVSG